MTTPSSTYRLQVQAGFDLDAAAEVTGYLRDLGVGWAYLSPILQAAEGSAHGYDVTDPTRVDAARGGPEGLARFAAAARAAGLGILVDIVPNHQGVAVPVENPWWWDVLARGRGSAHAASFDIDWDFGGGRVRLPVLGGELDEVLARGEVTVAPPGESDEFGTARYFDLVLPLAPGTAPLHATADAAAVRDVLARQHWEVAFWRDAGALNYRRFFTVTSLAGVCVEDEAVFDASHVEVLRWLREGLVDGLRIDHPDGLADPGGYLDALARAPRERSESKRPYVVVEKILERGEELPGWWATDGTTGYDALAEIDGILVDPEGLAEISAIDDWPGLVHALKREVADTDLAAEVARLMRTIPIERRRDGEASLDDTWRDAIAALLAAFPVYRAYLPAGAEHIRHALRAVTSARPDLAGAAQAVALLLATEPGGEFARRFMQTAGPVMAKGVEDRAFYRVAHPFTEVGGDPGSPPLDVAGFHAARVRRQASWPSAMTALTTHDTKRSEDVRARLAVLTELAPEWSAALAQLTRIASTGDAAFDDLLWRAVVGAWSDDPALPERLHAYAEKAAREAARGTTWTDPDAAFEARVHALVDAAFGAARPVVEGVLAEVADAGWSNSLSAKLLQLAGPGVPDVYQGTELWDLSLVDPDNRRPVDFGARRVLLARIDGGWHPPVDDTGAAKLLVVSRALRLRRDRPELFTRYRAVTAVGAASDHAIAFDRGGAIAVATRLPVGLARRGGWGDAAVMLPAGVWRDEFTGREVAGGPAPLAGVLAEYPVALLVRAP